MKVISKFAASRDVFFEAGDNKLPASGIEIIDRLIEGVFGSAQIKAYILNDLMLHYTFNRFIKPTDFIFSADSDLIVNSLILKSEAGVWRPEYEPYILSPEEVCTNQLFLKGDVPFRAPQRIELFRIFATVDFYMEILENYGDTFKEIILRIKKKSGDNIYVQKLPVSPKMKIIIQELLNYSNPNEILCRNFIRNKTLEIIHLQLEQIIAQTDIQNTVKLNRQDKQKIQEAQKILAMNFYNPPTVNQLAAMLATNEFKLKSGFNQLYHTSIYQYILEFRIEKSIEMMYNKNVTLEQISIDIGYSNLSHFTRAFKKVKGIAPSIFRAML